MSHLILVNEKMKSEVPSRLKLSTWIYTDKKLNERFLAYLLWMIWLIMNEDGEVIHRFSEEEKFSTFNFLNEPLTLSINFFCDRIQACSLYFWLPISKIWTSGGRKTTPFRLEVGNGSRKYDVAPVHCQLYVTPKFLAAENCYRIRC